MVTSLFTLLAFNFVLFVFNCWSVVGVICVGFYVFACGFIDCGNLGVLLCVQFCAPLCSILVELLVSCLCDLRWLLYILIGRRTQKTQDEILHHWDWVG